MKIFDKDGKWNFVDDNNVFVGFDSGQCCCEDFGYFFRHDLIYYVDGDIGDDADNSDLTPYNFDINFFEGNGGDFVVFKLVAQDKPDVYLYLYNFHNGYYSHGFEATVGGIKWQDGNI